MFQCFCMLPPFRMLLESCNKAVLLGRIFSGACPTHLFSKLHRLKHAKDVFLPQSRSCVVMWRRLLSQLVLLYLACTLRTLFHSFFSQAAAKNLEFLSE